MGDQPDAAPAMKRPPRLGVLVARVLVQDETVLGDLLESFAAHENSAFWYWKEVISMIPYAMQRRIDAVLAGVLGIVAGAGLIVANMVSRRGPYVLFIYAGLMLAVTLELRFAPVRRYARHFTITLMAFCVAFALQYAALMLSIANAGAISFFGHLWRIAFMLAIGAFFAAITSLFSAVTGSPYLLFPLFPIAAYLWFFVGRVAPPRVLRFVLPFGLIVNWRHDGWGWAFGGLDVLLWTLIAVIVFLSINNRRSPLPA